MSQSKVERIAEDVLTNFIKNHASCWISFSPANTKELTQSISQALSDYGKLQWKAGWNQALEEAAELSAEIIANWDTDYHAKYEEVPNGIRTLEPPTEGQ